MTSYQSSLIHDLNNFVSHLVGNSVLPGATTSTVMQESTTTPTPHWTTSMPGRMTSAPITDAHPPGHGQQHTHGSVITLPFGAKVTIPFGSTLFLPPGTQVEMQQQQPQLTPSSSPAPSSHSHHHHRSSSSIDVMSDPVNKETRSAVGNVDSDYYFDDEGAVDPGVTGGAE